MGDEKEKPPELKDLYKILLDTRNLEINLFWQRSNYFLVLNTGIAFGFFKLKTPTGRFTFAILGLLASVLWFGVCLGGKYWQARWEQRLLDFEKEHLPGLDFFAAGPDRIKRDAEMGLLEFHKLRWHKRLIYRLAVRTRPSVSYSMILLSIIFTAGWIAASALSAAGRCVR
ncbi:MAG: hypothetical protein ACLQKA_00105 [Bryobacteraceae bacterium]